jgi:hypothetical protein
MSDWKTDPKEVDSYITRDEDIADESVYISIAAFNLQATVNKHRAQERLTCRTNCWCWDAEALLIALEAAA